MKVIVLVAGYATRLYPLTLNTPKALLKIGEDTMLDFVMKKLTKIPEVDEVYLISNDKFSQTFQNWADNANYSFNIKVLNDGTNTNETRLGAIGDIQFVLENTNIDDDLTVLVSDNYFTFELSDFYDYYKNKQRDVVLGTKFEDLEYLSKHFGVAIIDEDDRVLDMVEKPGRVISDTGLYASYIFKKETLPMFKVYLDEGNSPDAPGNFIAWLHKRKPVYCYRFEGECYDIGTIDMYNTLVEKFNK
ncbi:MAG: nucleotidyltransferase family protein [Clostridia bacterium]|nr:nucleotidyltransferase family protein [Clostridia bacterium]